MSQVVNFPYESQDYRVTYWLMLKLKLQYFGHLMQRADSFEKTDAGKRLRGGGVGDGRGWDGWMASLTQRTHGFGWTPRVGDGQGGLACCDSWGSKESDMTEQLNWAELIHISRPFEPPSYLSSRPTPLDWYRAPVCVSWAIEQIPIGHLFYIW